jgi:hypothetical protein
MNIKPNQAVVLLTPLVFAPLAGAISVLVAKHIPGMEIDKGALEAVFIAGATIAFAKAGLWLKGWQAYEKRQDAGEPAVAGSVVAEPDLDVDDPWAGEAPLAAAHAE